MSDGSPEHESAPDLQPAVTGPDARDLLRRSALRTVDWLVARTREDGSLGGECTDLACFYKLPALMQLAGRAEQAHRLLDHVRERFLFPDGDLRTSAATRTDDAVLSLYPAYMSGWIAIGAQRTGRFDLSFPVWGRLRDHWNEGLDGFAIEAAAEGGGDVVELLTCAHLGLAALYFGDLELARGAARTLRRFLDLQPSPETRFYLRMAEDGTLQTEFPREAAGLYMVAADQPGQAWFFIGYPMAFLSRIYRATGEARHLAAAREYFAFAQRCTPNLFAEHFAHKVAWGSAELASVTGDPAPRALSAEIARHLVAAQDADGTWMSDQPLHTQVDQSAEVAIWFLEIAALT